MEKFGKWSDNKSGINPFLPPKINRGIVAKLLRWTLGSVFATIKLLVAGLLMIVYMILHTLLSILPRIPFLSRGLDRVVDYVFLRTILFFLGYIYVSQASLNTKSKRATPPPFPSISHGDLVITNRVSYMDILYFQAFFSPLFATVPNKYQGGEGGERKGEADKFGGGGDVGEGLGGGVWAVGFGGMLKDTIYVRERGVGGGDEWVMIGDLLKKAKAEQRGPVILCWEGTTSNGKGLLKTPQIFPCKSGAVELTPKNVHILGLKPGDDAVYIGVESFFAHIFSHCQSPPLSVFHVLAAAPSNIPPAPTSLSEKEWKEWEATVGEVQGGVLRVVRTGLSASDKRDFMKYWDKTFNK